MASDRDKLWDLLDDLLPEREIERSDVAGAMVEAIEAAGWRTPAYAIEDASELSALPANSVVLNTTTKVAWQRTRHLSWMSMTGLSDSRELFHAPGRLVLIYIPTKEAGRG